jgi:mycothiol system anti-sigma-R factor
LLCDSIRALGAPAQPHEPFMTNCPSGEQSPCQRTMEKIYEFLDGELTPDVDEQIRAHLAKCRGCFPHFEYERVFLRFLEKRAVIERAPPTLRRRIMSALMNEEVSRSEE